MADRARKQYEAMRGHFHRTAEQHGFTLDPAQELPVERISRLAGELAHPAWRLRRTPRRLYLWGPVGRGKSWLVNTFLDGPPIRLIEERMDVLDVSGPVDFRQQSRPDDAHGFALGSRLHPGDETPAGLTPPRPSEAGAVVAHHRELPARAVHDDHVWFGFQELCGGGTSVTDYLAVADRFPTIALDAVPPLTDASPDGRRRFANLVDVCCDRDIRLILIGADPLAASPPTRPSCATSTAPPAASPSSASRPRRPPAEQSANRGGADTHDGEKGLPRRSRAASSIRSATQTEWIPSAAFGRGDPLHFDGPGARHRFDQMLWSGLAGR
ncbi:cell division protein ZapE [Kitasatospora aureofaciens]|uniref:cell division protein ZapE n=1 Tax=Kitasatospora aureofaciens TaxID=1894 RepID=UPI0033D8B3B6